MLHDLKNAKSMGQICLLIPLMLGLQLAKGAKIIMSCPQLPSHVLSQVVVAEELVSRGHQVYLVLGSKYPNRDKFEEKGINVLTFHVPADLIFGGSSEMQELWSRMVFDEPNHEKTMEIDLATTPSIVNRDCELMMNDTAFLDSAKKIGFDIAVVEPFLLGPCALVLPKYLGIPFVSMAFIFVPWRQRIPALPSFYSRLILWKTEGTRMNFWQRLTNLGVFYAIQSDMLVRYNTTLLERFTDCASWDELYREAELVIVQADHLLDGPLPLMPNVIRLPGLTAKPARPLTADLEELARKPSEGVIYFSFGSIVHSIKPDIVEKFLAAFSALNYTVLAKLPVPKGRAVPENVEIRNWYPQNDVLGHPRTRLFLTHGGLFGQYEAIYHGVPTLGFPLFGDQVRNGQTAEEKGFGRVMNIHDFTVEQLIDNISEMVNNRKYADAAQKLSAIVRDEPMSGREKAAHWIEHVIKFGGEHLRSSALDMPLYQFLMLDVMALMFALLYVVVRLLGSALRLLWRKLRRRSSAASMGAMPKTKAE